MNNFLTRLLILTSILPGIVFAGTSGPSPIPAPPTFQISAGSLNLCKGVVNYVPVTVFNPGAQPMTSLQLGVVASRNIYVIGNGTVNQATVPANGTVVVRLPIFVSLNTSTLVSAGISVNYNYLTLYSDSEIRNVSFGVQTCASPLAVNISSAVVSSGRMQNMQISLVNNGNIPLTAISVKTSLPAQDAAILTPQPVLVSSLKPKTNITINNNVFIFRNATQSFPINISVTLYNGTSPVQILDTIQLLSSGIINITPSSITLSPQAPRSGGIFSASFILTDIGTTSASAVTATIISPKGFSSYGSNSIFVGDMQVDTQTPVTITLLANSTLKAGNYTIPVRLNYLNGLRQNQSVTMYVPVRIGSSFNGSAATPPGGGTTFVRTQSNSGDGLLILFLLLVIAALGFLLYKEKKSKRVTKPGR